MEKHIITFSTAELMALQTINLSAPCKAVYNLYDGSLVLCRSGAIRGKLYKRTSGKIYIVDIQGKIKEVDPADEFIVLSEPHIVLDITDIIESEGKNG